MINVTVYFALAIITALSALYLKQVRADIAICITLAGTLILIGGIVPKINLLVSDIRNFSLTEGIPGEYTVSILKIIGITYLCEFAADICTDAGEKTLSKHIETIGKVTVAFITLPIVEDVFSLILELLG